MRRWTHRLFNGIGLSTRADLYLDGKWSGLSSRPRSDPGQLERDAEAECNRLEQELPK